MRQIDASIVVTIHNTKEDFLAKCLDSIVNQTIKNIQIVLVDDGSETNGKIADYYAKMDNRIEVIHQSNQGVSVARNVAASRIKGKYAYFVDQDDWLRLDAIEKMFEAAMKYDADCVAIDGILVSHDGKFIKFEKPPYRYNHQDDWTGNACYQLFIKSELLNKHEKTRFPNDISFAEDTVFSFTFLSFAKIKVYLDEPLYFYRQHPQMSTSFSSVDSRDRLARHCKKAIVNIIVFLNENPNLQPKRKKAFFLLARTLIKYVYLNSKLEIHQYFDLIMFFKSKTTEMIPSYQFPTLFFIKDFIKNLFKKVEIRTIRKIKFLKRKNQKVSFYHYDSNNQRNFGDALSPYIVENLLHLNTKEKHQNYAELFGIGSILQILFNKKKYQFISFFQRIFLPTAIVWSSGLISPPQAGCALKRKLKIFALRGRLTRDALQCHTNQNLCNIALGDAGLLASDLLDNIPQKIYKVGIVPHFVDSENELIDQLLGYIPGATVINVCGDPIKTLHRIAECEIILSSSLHGLVVADSLGIPNQWIKFSDKVVGNDFKFRDYYSVYDIEPKSWDIRTMNLNYNDVLKIPDAYPIKKFQVEKIKVELIRAFNY